MIRSWLSSHLRVLVTATSSALVVALVAVAAIVSSGYTAQRLDLDAASVWVSNAAREFVGRANTQVFELDTVVASTGQDTEIVQSGGTVLLVDGAEATVGILDPATASISDTVALPPDRPRVLLSGDTVVVYSEGTGELWSMPVGSLRDFDTATAPSLNLGAGTLVSLDDAGRLFGFSPETQQVFEVAVTDAATVRATSTTSFESTVDDFAITSVDGRWVVLDTDTGVVETAAGQVSIAALADGAPYALQAPSLLGDTAVIGVSDGLVSVPFGGTPDMLVDGRAGTPAAPAVVDGCVFGAWTGSGAWRSCAGEEEELPLDALPGGAQLAFQANGDSLVLNDTAAGSTWAVQADGELIDNWERLIADIDEETVEQEDETTPPETEQQQVPPVAVDDELGARPGRATALPVLVNDYDANGDVLVITSVEAVDPAVGRVDVIEEGRKVQLTLDPAATGTVVFGYVIGDGRGGEASATVTVTVRGEGENAAPVQVRESTADVVSGGQVTTQVLGDWIDPDGDPLYLASASIAAPDQVSHKADGELFLNDSGEAPGTDKVVTIGVSDGTATGTGSVTVTSYPAGEAEIIAEPFGVLAYAGVERRIDPLEHVRGGNGAIRLVAVPAKTGVTIVPNLQLGTFRFTGDTPGTHYLEYTVTDEVSTVTGRVRVDVAAPPDANTTPITVPRTVFVPSQRSELVDVAATDIDPAGGVLVVTGVTSVTAGAALRAEVIEQRAVRVSLIGPLAGPVSVGYRISNGLAEAEGTITVIEIAPPVLTQPPIARDDTVTVRVGDATTIDVLGNDEHPDGEAITLDPVLVEDVGDGAGLLFVAGSTLRYLAPDTAGTVTATYQVLGPDGQAAQARLTIQVREPDSDTNRPPAPSRITARVLAGEQVRIDVPLNGIDPDGDSVQLLGTATNPEKGAVVEVGTDYIVYEAGEYSTGTDTFGYSLVDALGARATGIVRVGISPRLDGARNPVAVEDEVRARPGATVAVQVLANDSDPDGDALQVVAVETTEGDGVVAEIVDGTIVSITAPTAEDSYGLVYTIANSRGGTSANYITLVVDDDAPLARPIASDTVLTLADILDAQTVDVDVLNRVFFADGDARDLGVSLVPGYGGGQVLADKRIRVTITDDSQIIPFAVSHPLDSSVRSYAFIWVPGFDDALPQIDRRAPALQVVSEETLTIDLADHVIAIGGRSVRLTDSSTVTATHANGQSLVVDDNTLRFTSADLYFGPASISFEVTDGTSASDPNGRTANLVLPITVLPRENQPPVFNGAVLEFEPGQEKTIDLTALTTYSSDDIDELVYATSGASPTGFRVQLDGQRLILRAEDDAPKNTTTSLTLDVRDAVATGRSGRIELAVVPSTRPLARPVADTTIAPRGQTTVVDVLANDGPTNPFPGRPLTVVQVIGADAATLPTGVSITTSQANSRISITVDDSAAAGDLTLQYQVADATGDADRYTWGIVHVSIQDVPDAPAKPTRQAGAFVAGELKLRITPPQQNNAAITNYRVTSTAGGGYSHDCGTQLICTLPGLQVGTVYTFTVVATNAVGDSAPSPASDAYTIDHLPAAPSSVSAVPATGPAYPAGGAVTVSWTSVPDPNPGTAVTGYVVLVDGVVAATPGPSSTGTTVTGLTNDVQHSVAVYARNAAQVVSAVDWNRTTTTVHTIGPPLTPAPAPSATSATDGTITVSWGPAGSNGGGTIAYDVIRQTGAGGAADCATAPAIATGASSPWTDTSAVDGTTYTYTVCSSNGSYTTAAATGATVSLVAPGAGSATVAVGDHGAGAFDLRVTGLSVASGTAVRYEYRLSTDGTWREVPAGGWLVDGAVYGVPTDVVVRGCRDATQNYCGDASAATTATPVFTRVTAASCTVGAPPSITPPASSGAVAASYVVSYNVPLVLIDAWSAFGSPDDPVPAGAVGMRVKATVEGYTDPGYGEFPCA